MVQVHKEPLAVQRVKAAAIAKLHSPFSVYARVDGQTGS
jgi:hypothetical protein